MRCSHKGKPQTAKFDGLFDETFDGLLDFCWISFEYFALEKFIYY